MLDSSVESIAAFDRMLFDACALLRPPEHLTVDEWADRHYHLSPEGSANPGKYYVSTAEYQRGPLRALSDVAVETVVLDWASQVGKTQIGLIFVGFKVHQDPMPILFAEPTENLSKTVAIDRIMPMIRDNAVLTPLFSSGRKDPMHLSFPGGHITSAWATSATEFASRAIGAAVSDEEDRPGYDENPEGDPVGMLRKRLATFPGRRKHLRISSPGLKRTSRITRAYTNSDQRKYYVPCPQCGHMQTLRFEQLQRPKDPETGRWVNRDCYYVCEESGCVITHDDKFEMIRNGDWRAENPGGGDGRTAGFHLSALYSTIGYSWAEILDEYDSCEGLPDKIQVFQNTVLAEPWDEQAEGADLNELAKHAEPYAAPAPMGVNFITCGADVQKDRIEASKWGWGLSEQSWLIEHRVFYGDPVKQPEVWAEFEAWRATPVVHESGLDLPTVCTFVDAGDGNRVDAVHAYTLRHQHRKVFASKGASQVSAPVVSDAKPQGHLRALQVLVGQSTVKDTLYGRFGIYDKTRPGYVHFPDHASSGCSPVYFDHLTAEALVTKQTRQGEKSQWEKIRPRNEALDCAVYAYAAKLFTRANLKLLAQQMHEKIDRLAGKLEPPPPPGQGEFARTGAALLSPSSASSAPLPSPQAPSRARKLLNRLKSRVRMPGFGWIHRS